MRVGALVGFAVLLLSLVAAKTVRVPAAAVRLSIEPEHLPANGYDTATLRIESAASTAPRITVDKAHAVTIEGMSRIDGGWEARVRAGVMAGRVEVTVERARATLVLEPDNSDSMGDGTPDYLRLDDSRDQEAFRRWFTFLAEVQYFQAPEARPAEIDDCAALIRYAYREALRAHDSARATASHLPVTPAFESVAKYQYPYTGIGANLFRVAGGFAQFADAQTLQRLNTHLVSRDIARALPGDLLFYRQDAEHMPYHSMIFVGPSQVVREPGRYVVYHTGSAEDPAYKRLTLDQLAHYPEIDWRAVESNPYFLGVYRWNILRNIP